MTLSGSLKTLGRGLYPERCKTIGPIQCYATRGLSLKRVSVYFVRADQSGGNLRQFMITHSLFTTNFHTVSSLEPNYNECKDIYN